MPRTETVGVKVTPEMKEALRKAARVEERPLSTLVAMILRNFLDKQRLQQRKAAK
jgi:predicted transcriptional regulator